MAHPCAPLPGITVPCSPCSYSSCNTSFTLAAGRTFWQVRSPRFCRRNLPLLGAAGATIGRGTDNTAGICTVRDIHGSDTGACLPRQRGIWKGVLDSGNSVRVLARAELSVASCHQLGKWTRALGHMQTRDKPAHALQCARRDTEQPRADQVTLDYSKVKLDVASCLASFPTTHEQGLHLKLIVFRQTVCRKNATQRKSGHQRVSFYSESQVCTFFA
jgi:hypothetical protein